MRSPIGTSALRSTGRGRRAEITVSGPEAVPADLAGVHAAGAAFWPLAMARELDDAILHLRFNEPELGIIVFRSEGEPAAVLAADALLDEHADDWLVREVRLYWKRVLKRIDMTSRSLFALIEPGSCFAGMLAELVFRRRPRADVFRHAGRRQSRTRRRWCCRRSISAPMPMGNGLSRLATRFLGEPDSLERAEQAESASRLLAEEAEELGLVTAAYDEVDWDEEVRLDARGARELFAGRADRARSESALRRAGDDGDEDFRPAQRLAELDFPAPERGR